MQRACADNDGCADESGERVDIRSQHSRNFSYEHIPNHSAADPRQSAEKNGRDRTDMERQRFIGARRDKKGEAGGIEEQDRAAQPVDQGIPEERDHAGKDGDGEICPIIYRRRRNGSDHDVPGNSAGVSRRKAENQNAKEIQFMLDGLGCPAEGEDECSCKVEYGQQRIGQMGIDGSHLHHADSQACAATTMASTPAFKVGLITGAKRGL